MHVFKDNAGRTWPVSIHVSAVKRVRGMLGVDLYSLIDDRFQGLGKLLADPVSLVDVLYVLCKDEADKQGITDEDFGRAMAGDAIEHATHAFLEEFADFFPDPRARAGIKKMTESARKMRDTIMTHLTTQIETFDPETAAKKLIDSSGNSQALSA